jgi:flagellar assembly factor FliW
MVLTSSRFGEVEVPDDAIVRFPTGLIGLGGSRYALLANGPDPAVLWLQSLEDPAMALPVTDPFRHFDSYEIELTEPDAERTATDDLAHTSVYVTVRATEGGDGFSANLRAPILIAGSTGHQVINQAADAPVRAPLPLGRRAAQARVAA